MGQKKTKNKKKSKKKKNNPGVLVAARMRATAADAQDLLFEIYHNPYTMESTLHTEGLQKVHALELTERFHDQSKNSRLQFWIDECLKMILGVKSTGNTTVRFRGIEADCADVDEAFQVANSAHNLSANLELAPVQDNPRERLNSLAQLLRDIEHSDFEGLNPGDIEDIIQRIESTTFDVNVLGCMKAGKSTVINALLGQDLLPEETEACTAKIIEIFDFDTKECPEGRKLIRQEESTKRLKWETIDKEVLTAWNREASVARIEIQTDVPAIAADPLQLKLVDTPGPNNSRDQSHGMATHEFLSNTSMSMVIYMLSASTTFTDDDKKLLKEIARQMNEYGKQAHDRFIFLLTRADEYKENESIELKVRGVMEHLSEDYGIPNPKVFPVSAYFAKLIRMKQHHSVGPGAEAELFKWIQYTNNPAFADKYNLNAYMTLSKMVKGHISSRLNCARNGNSTVEQEAKGSLQTNGLWSASALEYALLCTGIPALEACIQEYMRRYAFTARIHDLTSEILKCLNAEQAIRDLEQEMTKSLTFRDEVAARLREISSALASGEITREEIQKRISFEGDMKVFDARRQAIRIEETSKFNIGLEKLFDKKKFIPAKGDEQYLDAAKKLVTDILEDSFSQTVREAEQYERRIIARSLELYEIYLREVLGSSSSLPKFDKIFVKFEFSEDEWARGVRGLKPSSYEFDDGIYNYLRGFFSKRYKVDELKGEIVQAYEIASHRLSDRIVDKLNKLRSDTDAYLNDQDKKVNSFVDEMLAKIEDEVKEQENAIAKEKQIAEKLRVVANFRDSLHSMNAL